MKFSSRYILLRFPQLKGFKVCRVSFFLSNCRCHFFDGSLDCTMYALCVFLVYRRNELPFPFTPSDLFSLLPSPCFVGEWQSHNHTWSKKRSSLPSEQF